MNQTKPLPNIGDRLVIHGMSGFVARVQTITWSTEDLDWLIRVDWGEYGSSRVWARDEGNVWYRLLNLN